jgi:hypothetical protein
MPKNCITVALKPFPKLKMVFFSAIAVIILVLLLHPIDEDGHVEDYDCMALTEGEEEVNTTQHQVATSHKKK